MPEHQYSPSQTPRVLTSKLWDCKIETFFFLPPSFSCRITSCRTPPPTFSWSTCPTATSRVGWSNCCATSWRRSCKTCRGKYSMATQGKTLGAAWNTKHAAEVWVWSTLNVTIKSTCWNRKLISHSAAPFPFLHRSPQYSTVFFSLSIQWLELWGCIFSSAWLAWKPGWGDAKVGAD